MIIYSWNMLFENQKLDLAFEFIKNTEFDVFCLQEVPEEFLTRLKSLPCHLATCSEVVLSTSSRTFSIYSVIISKYEIKGTDTISFPKSEEELRTRVTRFFMSLLAKDERITDWHSRGSLFADISTEGKELRIFNLHLTLSYPKQRLDELRLAMSKKKETSIVCGDFNVLETWYISLVNWLLGGTISDWVFYKRERHILENYFETLGLTNPLKNKKTHSVSGSQLDHILIPSVVNVTKAAVLPNTYGSDHKPIQVQIEF